MKLLVNPQQFFFDRARVLNALNAGTAKAMSRIGAFVMRGARRLIRPGGKKGKVSLPGEAPRSHTGLLRDRIFFNYDPSTKSVVVGPEKLSSKDGSAPAALEYGGRVKVVETETPEWWTANNGVKVWRQLGKRHRGDMPTRIRIATIAPRPYMATALAKEIDNKRLASAWENVIK